MEDFEARNQPCLPEGQRPAGDREAKEFAAALCLPWVVSQLLTFQRGPSGQKPSSVFQGLHSCREWMPHVPLIWDRSCLTACGWAASISPTQSCWFQQTREEERPSPSSQAGLPSAPNPNLLDPQALVLPTGGCKPLASSVKSLWWVTLFYFLFCVP